LNISAKCRQNRSL